MPHIGFGSVRAVILINIRRHPAEWISYPHVGLVIACGCLDLCFIVGSLCSRQTFRVPTLVTLRLGPPEVRRAYYATFSAGRNVFDPISSLPRASTFRAGNSFEITMNWERADSYLSTSTVCLPIHPIHQVPELPRGAGEAFGRFVAIIHEITLVLLCSAGVFGPSKLHSWLRRNYPAAPPELKQSPGPCTTSTQRRIYRAEQVTEEYAPDRTYMPSLKRRTRA